MNIQTLMAAAEKGDTHSVALYVQSCDEQTKQQLLETAARHNHANCVELLVSECSSGSVGWVLNELIRENCVKGVVCVLEYVDNIRVFNAALGMSALCNQQECLNILYPLADVPLVLRSLREQYYSYNFNSLENMYNAEQQKTVLTCAVENTVQHQKAFKKM